MSLNRRNPRRDANEKEITDALDTLGIIHWPLSDPGIPDLLCLYRQEWVLIEVKAKRGKLNRQQIEFFELARDMGAKRLYVVRSVQDLLECLAIA